jgi:hypothetical protein
VPSSLAGLLDEGGDVRDLLLVEHLLAEPRHLEGADPDRLDRRDRVEPVDRWHGDPAPEIPPSPAAPWQAAQLRT